MSNCLPLNTLKYFYFYFTHKSVLVDKNGFVIKYFYCCQSVSFKIYVRVIYAYLYNAIFTKIKFMCNFIILCSTFVAWLYFVHKATQIICVKTKMLEINIVRCSYCLCSGYIFYHKDKL